MTKLNENFFIRSRLTLHTKCLPELFELIPDARSLVSFHLYNWQHQPWLLWLALNHDNPRASMLNEILIRNYAFSVHEYK